MSVKHTAWVWEQSRAEGGTLLVALALADSVNHLDGSDECWPKQELLARRTRLSERTVQRAVSELEELGEIKRNRRPDGSNAYRFLLPDKLSAPVTDGGSDPTSVTASPVTSGGSYVEPEVRTGKEPEVQGALLPDPVEDVWQHYAVTLNRPRAQLTPKVRKWIADAIKAVGVDECKRAISGLAASDYHMQNNYVGIEYALVPKRGQTIESRVAFMAGKAGGGTGANALPTVEELLRTVPSGGAEIVRLRMERARAFIEMSDEQKQRAQQGDERAVGIVQDGNEALRLLREAPPRVEAVIDGGRLKGWRRV